MKVLLHPVVNDEPAPTPDMKLLEPVIRSLKERVTVVNPVFLPKKTLSEASLWYPADCPIATEPLVSVLQNPAHSPMKLLQLPVVFLHPASCPKKLL